LRIKRQEEELNFPIEAPAAESVAGNFYFLIFSSLIMFYFCYTFVLSLFYRRFFFLFSSFFFHLSFFIFLFSKKI